MMSKQVDALERRIDREMAKVDSDGNYPCTLCGKRTPLETMGPLNDDTSAPLICESCEKVYTDDWE